MLKLKMRDIKGILIGVTIACISCIAIVAGITSLVLAEQIGEKGAEAGINTAVVFASMIGGLFVNKLTGKPLTGSIINAAILLCIMVTTAMILDGEFQNGAVRIIALAVGCVISYAISLKKGKSRKNGIKRYR